MPYIPQEELDRIKQQTNLVALVQAKGVTLKPHGKDLIGLCPLHDDHNPSLVVTPSKNLWHCLGACQAGGSAIDWVMKSQGVSFRHAVEILRGNGKNLLIDSPAERPAKYSTVRTLSCPIDPDADDPTILKQVIDYYHQTLKSNPDALGYLEKRGIKNDEAINTFKLGFADRTLGIRLPMKNRREGARIRQRLIDVGILRESGHEHFCGSLVIPVIDQDGNITEIYGRKIRDDLRPETIYHLYLPGPHKGIFNPSCLQSEKIILCEALIDALTFWVHGFSNVTASYGVEGFTQDHLETFILHKTKTVLIAYDRDQAGEKAAAKLADKLMAHGMESFSIQFPWGMDANEYACKVTPAAKSLEILINSAIWLGKGPRPLPSQIPADASPAQVPAPSSLNSLAAIAAKENITTTAPKEKMQTGDESSAVGAKEPAIALPAQTNGEDIIIALADREYRVRGLAKNTSFEILKINLRVMAGERYHVDTLDLYNARHRSTYIQTASQELAIQPEAIKKDLGQLLLRLEDIQEQHIKTILETKAKEPSMSDQERETALELLRDPRLMERILKDFDACGVVGEKTNKVTGYLACVSRKLEEPLALIIQSSSAAGKSALLDAILSFIPQEEKVKYTAMTGQALFYLGETDLKHKILAIVEEEGAKQASYALKLLQSEGELIIASTGKDPQTGRLVTQEYQVQGPVGILLTTTAIDIDEELLNRCIVLTVDESREQTRAIHQLQRESQTLEGMLAKLQKETILKNHQNAQRLIRPLKVVNPYARQLSFLDDQIRARRDHIKYLTLIRVIALLHQYQRPVKTSEHNGKPVSYVEVCVEDIALANQLAHEVLGRSLDELPPQTRRFLDLLNGMAQGQCREQGIRRCDYRFTQRAARMTLGWTDFQVKTHLRKLVDLEYVLVHRGGRGQSFVYELLYDGEGKDGKPFLMGLIDTKKLQYDQKWVHEKSDREHEKGNWEVSGSIEGAPREHGGSMKENSCNPDQTSPCSPLDEKTPENHYSAPKNHQVVTMGISQW